MSILNPNPLSIIVSIMALSGILAHGVQAEFLAKAASILESKNERLVSSQHIHVETDSYNGTTYGMRSQSPAARPQDDGDKDTILKKRTANDGFGNDNSSWAI